MIVDFHNHIGLKGTEGEWVTPEEFVRAMDSGGIDKAVILGIDQVDPGTKPPWSALAKGPVMKKGWLPQDSRMPVAANLSDEDVAKFGEFNPDRLIGFASIHPARYRPDLKVEHAITRLGLKGVKVYPHAGFYPNDLRLDRVYEKCAQLGVPVMIHTGIKALAWQWIKYNNPIYVDDVATNFPDLDIIMCHGGFPWCDEFLTVAYSNPNIWVDITFMDYIEKAFGRPGLVESTMRSLVNLVGADRILWGSEGPEMYLPLYGQHDTSYYQRSQDFLVNRFDFLTDQDKENILGQNALRLLKLQHR
jgi:predicted TIM-barrel fold metal-dependent hydrolase